jgi:hypothetical protein
VITNYQPIVPLVSIPSFPIRSTSVRTILRNAPVGTAAVAMPANLASKENTTLTITSHNPNFSKVFEPVDVYFTLAYTGAPPTGEVLIIGSDDDEYVPTMDGSNDDSCSVDASTLGTGGVGHCILTPDTPGPWTITAVYIGDDVYNGSLATADHQVYYVTTVVITSVNPEPSHPNEPVQVGYSFTVDPVDLGEYRLSQKLILSDNGINTCEIASFSSGSCTFVYQTAEDVTILASYSGDPYFMASSASVFHEVVATYTSSVSITEIRNANPALPGYKVGDQAIIRFKVSGGADPSVAVPSGLVKITDLSGLYCEANINADGEGECTVMLNSRGPSGFLTFSALYTGSNEFEESRSPAQTIDVDRILPNLFLLATNPQFSSGIYQPVRVSFKAAPNIGTSKATGKMRVLVTPDNVACEGTLDVTTGEGFCSVTLTVLGDKKIHLFYEGDHNFLSADKEFPNTDNPYTHRVDNCPSIINPRFVVTSGSGNEKKIDNQIIVTLSNPNGGAYEIQEVDLSYPYQPTYLVVSELHYGPTGGDASDWRCNIQGNTLPPYCLLEEPSQQNLPPPPNSNTMTYYASAVQANSCLWGVPGITCLGWKPPSQTNARLSLASKGSADAIKDLYFVLSYTAPTVWSYNLQVRLKGLNPNEPSNKCEWIRASFKP